MKYKSTELLADLRHRTQAVVTYLKTLTEFSNEELNWKPGPESWSILECVQHLLMYGNHYNSEFSKKILTNSTTPSEQHTMSWLGRKFAESMSPDSRSKKVKTLKSTNPLGSKISTLAIDQLVGQQTELLKILDKSYDVNLTKLKASTSLASWLKLRFGDMLIVHVWHNQRHIEQIKELIANPNFAGSTYSA